MKIILEKYKRAHNLRTDAELADFLGLKTNTIASWKVRGGPDYGLLIEKCSDAVDLNSLFRSFNFYDSQNIQSGDLVKIDNDESISYVTIPLIVEPPPFQLSHFTDPSRNRFITVPREYVEMSFTTNCSKLIAVSLLFGTDYLPSYLPGTVVFVDTSARQVKGGYADYLCLTDFKLPAVLRLLNYGAGVVLEFSPHDQNGIELKLGVDIQVIGKVVGHLNTQNPLPRIASSGSLKWEPERIIS